MHIFCSIQVRGMLNTDHGEVLSTVGRTFLEQLPDTNSLKPKVWAHQISKPGNFGVSLGVRNFVRPLYLCIKLTQITQLRNVEKCKLEDVKAIKMRGNYMVKDPCVSCQKSFGFISFPPPRKLRRIWCYWKCEWCESYKFAADTTVGRVQICVSAKFWCI